MLIILMTGIGQICTNYSEGLCFVEIKGEVVYCRTPSRTYNFKILDAKINDYNVALIDDETEEIRESNYRVVKFGNCDSIKIYKPNGSTLSTYYSKVLNPFTTNYYNEKTEFTIQDYFSSTINKYEILRNGYVRHSNEHLETLDTFQLSDIDLKQLNLLIQNINVESLSSNEIYHSASNIDFYSVNFISYDLKNNSITYQFTPKLLEEFEEHIYSIIRKRRNSH